MPTLDGEIKLSIPANSQAGDKLRVKGKGLSSKSVTGDLIAIVKVVMPDHANEQSKRIWQELSANETFDPRKEWSVQS
jgi:curved DNA-binding protein